MAKQFEEKKFNIPALKGISAKTIEEHLKLYAGYVKNSNDLLGGEEYNRRFPFEFNGMRNHEIYFSHFEGGAKSLATDSEFVKAGFDLEKFKALALTRGVGWAIVYYDPISKQLIHNWVDEQHLGQLSSCIPILALDMWEHSYVADYQPSGKKQYVEDFFENLNWKSCEENFANATRLQ
ncbi:MAG: Fe-Mn family superoxide dismutase [bacterium]|nr:Fe-Mn family superoxide dismutase [bacterium]